MGSLKNGNDIFVEDLKTMFKQDLYENVTFGQQLWSAMANVDWYHPQKGLEASFSFRVAGGVIAEIIGEGSYMDWYCSGPPATVSNYIARAMRKCGWIYDDICGICDEPGCVEEASCGTPTPDGYRNTCFQHMPELFPNK